MKKVILIGGKQGSGKSTLARKLATEKGTFAEVTTAGFREYLETVDVFIFDWVDVENLEELKYLCKSEVVGARKAYQRATQEYKTPDLIIITITSDFIATGLLNLFSRLPNLEIYNL